MCVVKLVSAGEMSLNEEDEEDEDESFYDAIDPSLSLALSLSSPSLTFISPLSPFPPSSHSPTHSPSLPLSPSPSSLSSSPNRSPGKSHLPFRRKSIIDSVHSHVPFSTSFHSISEERQEKEKDEQGEKGEKSDAEREETLISNLIVNLNSHIEMDSNGNESEERDTVREMERITNETDPLSPTQTLPDTFDSSEFSTSDKDSSVPSVIESISSDASGKPPSIFSRLRKAVQLTPFHSPSGTEAENSPSRKQRNSQTKPQNPLGFLFPEKPTSIYDQLKDTQTLSFHQGPIWATAFSLDGRYLATGGKDCRVVVWSVGIDRRGVSDDDIKREGSAESSINMTMDAEMQSNYSSSAFPLLFPIPCRVFREHVDDVIDLSWTRKHFLLSASADKTVRLWNVRRYEYYPFISSSFLLGPSVSKKLTTLICLLRSNSILSEIVSLSLGVWMVW